MTKLELSTWLSQWPDDTLIHVMDGQKLDEPVVTYHVTLAEGVPGYVSFEPLQDDD